MCLTTKQEYPFIAEENIICYKVLERHDGFFCKCETPFRGLKVQGKTSEEITNYTNCCLDDVEAVSKTYDFLESRETLEKGELVDKSNELKRENDAIKDELQRVYRAIATYFLFKEDKY